MATTSTSVPAETGYHIDLEPPQDDDIPSAKRSRSLRWTVLLSSCAVIALVPIGFGDVWGTMLGSADVGMMLGSSISLVSAIIVLPTRFFVNNPEWSGYVTEDPFSGEMVPYGPGLSISLPWEERNKRGNYPLKIIGVVTTVDVQTSTAKVKALVTYQYAYWLPNLDRAIGVSQEAIEGGLTGFISSFLSARFAQNDAEFARTHIKDANKALATDFMRHENGKPAQFEDKYGFIITSVIVNKIDFPDNVQKARDTIDEGAAMHKTVAALHGMSDTDLSAKVLSGAITHDQYKEMLNRAMAMSGNAKLDINVIEANFPEGLVGFLKRFVGTT